MRKLNLYLSSLLMILLFFTSCEKSDSKEDINLDGDAIVINYGGYGSGNGEFSLVDEANKKITNNYFKLKNGIDFGSNIQSASLYDGKIYCMTNSADKIDIINIKDFKQEISISDNIAKPRYSAAQDGKIYISCIGQVADWSKVPNSYLAVLDVKTQKVTKYPKAGGIEGVIVVDDKVYCAGYSKKEVHVFDIKTKAFIKSIPVKGLARHFALCNGKLWVSLVSSYSVNVPKEDIGLACINTTNNTIEANVNIPNIGSNGYIQATKKGDKIFVLENIFNPDYTTNSNISIVNTQTKAIENASLYKGESFYGLGYNKITDKLYILVSPSTSTNGTLLLCDTKGNLIKEIETGIAPQHVVFYQ